MKINLRHYKVTVIFTVIFICAFFAGLIIGTHRRSADSETFAIVNSTSTIANIDLAPLWKVWQTLDEKFVQTHKNVKAPTDQDKVWGAIKGLTASFGDQYTVFFPPEENKDFQSDIEGNFGGVGMELGLKDKNIVVVSPLKDSPSAIAGIKKGDIVLSIDGTSTQGMAIDQAVGLIRGPVGTVVKIKILHEGADKPVELSITRAVIEIPTVDTEIKNDVFVIHLYNFNATSPEKFRQGLRDFISSGKNKLVLDLRGNPGGYLEAAVDMGSFFLPLGKTIVIEDYGKGKDQDIYRSKGYNVFNDNLKMAILIDEGSASAAEILAGALHEQGVAKLVGTKSFGKGSVQELVPITDDTSLKVTVARWLTPKGNSISDGGLAPDYEVKFTDADAKAGRDPQLDKAIESLN